jgi:hypothetical protein
VWREVLGGGEEREGIYDAECSGSMAFVPGAEARNVFNKGYHSDDLGDVSAFRGKEKTCARTTVM